MEIVINRIWTAPASGGYLATTTGVVSIDEVQTCYCLERTDEIIPEGTFTVKLQWSDRFQRKTPWILGVPGRTDIEIHGANWATDLEGCVGVAERRISDYMIQDSLPATSNIESMLANAEANNETNTVTISGTPSLQAGTTTP